ncbi:STN and carboxypeptidase regulatory-like domain-containing protein [Flavitalea sp. BT771]|uniref:STN and carboxypeptidase regulatory-like domain-containing protein n=1 Tax=Flavitalea sp. BT771 TaxID=3063329 RepID=UPI0026E38675|nr:STN and carboxypeptidase regulatory-like domain-containing protein [Flavitalea sp. BT771]MDO6432317.1 STN and carboxypeptidase regulatory-like domain-containing protein [Flavitalea sp. BT771]MDV6221227.1 STN and carboxypeptidase regulatory-like domain-containing protein [Flavitalea sp. BT771]
MKLFTITAAFLFIASSLHSQSVLDKQLSVEFRQQRLDKALEVLSHNGNFYFSYNSSLLKRDSLVTLSAQNKTVRQILDLLFRGSIEYKENGNYIILRKAPPKLSATLIRTDPGNDRYIVSGVILDENTGETISQASVYDKHGLIATLTNEDGSFTVRLKNRPGPAALTVSKEFYEDTTVKIEPGANQKITVSISPLSFSRKMVTISPDGYLPSDSIRVELDGNSVYMRKDPIRVEMTGWGRLLLSSRLKIQSINLRKYFTQQPFQLSFLPGIGTQGPLSPQITNKFSVNMLGGYTAGLIGAELGGVFNVDKRNVQGVQAAGVINVVGGSVEGVQMAGLHNTILDSLKGVQMAGISNITRRKLKGVQMAGVYNRASDTLQGLQAAGVLNKARDIRGIQISGLVNIARHSRGVQVGIINIADTSDGCSIGLINLSRNGFREYSLFADEVAPANFAFRSGNTSLYSILLIGYNPLIDHRSYRYGWGLGHRFGLNKKLSLDPELTNEHVALYDGSKYKKADDLFKLNLDLHARLGRHFAISGGPSLTFYSFNKNATGNDHTSLPAFKVYPQWTVSDSFTGWLGWRVSVSLL